MTFRYRLEGDDRPAAELPRFETLEELEHCLQDHAEMEAELEAERRNERFFEEGTAAQQMQYQWEVEQDEARAAGMGGF